MKCPKCKGPMAALYHNGMQIERCTKCGALWFDMLDAAQMRALPGADPTGSPGDTALRALHAEGEIKCPICGDLMLRMADDTQPHLWYELCPSCDGVFFDAGEYEEYRNETIGTTCERLFSSANA